MNCFAGCETEVILEKLGLKMADLFSAPKPGTIREKPITVALLAQAKGLPEQFLRQQEVTDAPGGVKICYRLEDGSRAERQRLRKNLAGDQKYVWLGPKEHKPVPYGLDKLPKERACRALYIVEGETDTLTLRLHGYDVLGVPGARVAGSLRQEHLEGFETVYVARERDDGGPKFVSKIKKLVREWGLKARVVEFQLPTGIKDVNELHQRGAELFDIRLADAVAQGKVLHDGRFVTSKGAVSASVSSAALIVELGAIAALSQALSERFCFAKSGGRLYMFSSEQGRYVPVVDEVEAAVQRQLRDWHRTTEWRARLGQDVQQYLRVDAKELWITPPTDIINVKNGLVRVADGTLLPHTPEHLSPVQLPAIYDPTACGEIFRDFVSQLVDPDAVDLLTALPGIFAVPVIIDKVVLLIGDGGDGKSTYIKVLTAFLGAENVSALTLQQIEHEKFAPIELNAKLANLCADLPADQLRSTEILKKVTSGDDVQFDQKFRDLQKLRPTARLLFASNHPPRARQTSQGYYDRWLVIRFPNRFRDTPKEILANTLLPRLTSTLALSGMLNLGLAGLRGYLKNPSLLQPASCRTAHAAFQAATDPVAVWLDRHVAEDDLGFVEKDEARQRFNDEGDHAGRPRLSSDEFGRAVARARPDLKDAEKQRTVKGKGLKRGWPGYRLV